MTYRYRDTSSNNISPSVPWPLKWSRSELLGMSAPKLVPRVLPLVPEEGGRVREYPLGTRLMHSLSPVALSQTAAKYAKFAVGGNELLLLPGAYLTVSQLSTGLKEFLEEILGSQLFWRCQCRQQFRNDHLVVCEGSRRTCALLYFKIGAEGSSGLVLQHAYLRCSKSSANPRGQEHRHRKGGAEVLRQASALHFRMPR